MCDELSAAERLERIEAALRWMPRDRRNVYLAARLDAMSYTEIAERTGLSVRQVEQHMALAVRAIADAIDGRLPRPWWRRWIRWINTDH